MAKRDGEPPAKRLLEEGFAQELPAAAQRLRQRIPNAYYGDLLYYDVGSLTPAELSAVSPKRFGRGALVVYHRGRVYTGERAHALALRAGVVAMTGVGSSVYGTLAFAKQISQATGQTVAGIVTGRGGSAGVLQDGPEGYFISRVANAARQSYGAHVRGLVARLRSPLDPIQLDPLKKGNALLAAALQRRDPEQLEAASDSLISLLEAGARPRFLVGHSKGAMDLANALLKLEEQDRLGLARDAAVVSLGMPVLLPGGVPGRHYLGSADALGKLNAVQTQRPEVVLRGPLVEGRSHSLSTDARIAPTAMPAREILREAFGALDAARSPLGG